MRTSAGVQANYPLERGDDVAVVYRDANAVLALHNESAPHAASTVSAGRGQPATKTAADEHIKGLLSRWSDLGFFEAAQANVHPQAKASLTLVINGRRYVCSRPPLAVSSVEDIERFNGYTWAFRTVYDNTQTYQPASLKAGDFYRENQRLLDNAREAKARENSGWGRK